ncbi:Transposase-like Mu [Solidesulfovibrio carbinoliphilus subsp. oakridgensis]|uniref:Transposase-like Mu n=1 Tax=Solidesulfovibrio carbinoliphilus subsp. oakridgensis TaxID=694327 RepID=G7QD55_9BACT|nr:Mu transposase C-terminal domain-containing protein [Solidesulfovibrio carbinoliphilus]EHJ46361.1 Transposase-like Mu [Solidesulfovibrio carbinoliphilus subsp. oakridgensis]
MQGKYPAKAIAQALDISERATRMRADRESWPFEEEPCRGGKRRLYQALALPEDVRTALIAIEATNLPATATADTSLTENQRRKALAKADLVRLYTETLSKAANKGRARDEFIAAYAAGVWPAIKATLGDISWKSLERWKTAMRRTGSALALADTRGGVRVEPVVTERHAQILLALARHPNKPCLSEVCRMAREAFKPAGLADCAEITLYRYLRKWMTHNYGEWVYARQGKKAWNDECCPYIERDYSKIHVGDILVADGHALNFEILDPETGKGARMELVLWFDMASNFPLGWEILPTENTQAIASALRRACLRLGKFPKVAYLDNGRAFRSKFFNGVDLTQGGLGGVFQELGIEPLFAWPYHGQSKTIERFFKTFGELERWIPSYVGTSIESKPPRLMRGEKLHRKVYETSGGRPLTLEEAHTAIATWFDAYAERPQRGHLKGRTPGEAFAAGVGPGLSEGDLLKLRLCMLSKAVRQIEQNGVKIFGRYYRHPFLHSLRHPVLVRYDDQDRRTVLVYDQSGKNLICEATPAPNPHPAARILGTEEDQTVLAQEIAYKKALENQVTSNARNFLNSVVLPETQSRMRLVAAGKTETPALPGPKAPDVKSIEAAKAAVVAKREAAPAYTPPAQMATIVTELDRYEYLFTLAVRDGVALREADADWMARYEQTEEYAACARGRFERLRTVYKRRRLTANGGDA